MKPIKTFFINILGILMLFSINVLPQENYNKILFLHFHFINGLPELISMNVVNGKMKTRKNDLIEHSGYSIVLFSDQKKILYKNNFDDPTENIYECPNDNGEINRIKIIKDTVYYSFRTPYSKDINKIILYKTATKSSLLKSSINSFEAKYEFLIDHSMIKHEN